MNLQSAINANRKREQEKQLKAKQLRQDVTKLDWLSQAASDPANRG